MTSKTLLVIDVPINSATLGTPSPQPCVPPNSGAIQGGTPGTPVTFDNIVVVAGFKQNSTSSASAAHDHLANDISIIQKWLQVIGEEDTNEIARIEQACRESRELRDEIVRLAHGVIRPAPQLPDERRYCSECANLTNDWCAAAFRSEINAARWYQPPKEVLMRCERFVPRMAPTSTSTSSDQSS